MQTPPAEAGGLPGDEHVPNLPTDAGVPGSVIDFRIIAEKSLSLILVTDQDGTIQYVNPTFCNVTGWTPGEIVGQRVQDLGRVDPRAEAALRDSLGSGMPWRGEFPSQTKKGNEIWVHCSASPVTDASGRVTHFIAVNLDITERKRTEQALAESEEMFRTLVDSMPAAVVIFQGDHVRYANRTCFDVLGYSPEDLPKLRYWDAIHPDYRDLVRERGSARLRGEDVPNNYEMRFLRKNGEARWGIYSGAAITYQGKPAVLGVIHDITERKEMERAVAESEEKFRSLVETSTEIVWAIDGDLRVTYVNPTVERILGYTPEELLGRYSIDFLYPDDIEPTLAWLRDAASSATGWPTIVDRWLGKDGSWRYIDTGGVPIVDDQGTVTGFRGVGRDVTDRYLAEQACRRSEERFRLLYQDNPSMYFTLSEDLSVFSVNRHGAEQLGYEAEELVGGSVLTVVHPDDQTHVRRQLESLLKNRGAKHGLEFRKIRKDGSVMWVKESVSVTQDADGERIILVVCEDISERKQMEEALQGLREELERKAQRAVEGQNPYGLTFREATVLHLVTGGRSDKEIGVVLGIRSQTVSKHVANVLKKMKASSRTQAGVRALREGLIS